MSRISARFDSAKRGGSKLLIPYVTAGDPDPETSLRLLNAMAKAGADIIEIGVPFSDPMADGPVIQAACERALKAGMSLAGVLELVRRFRAGNRETPIVLMGYLNPIEAMGYQAFSEAAAKAGVDGVLTVDLPPEESAGLRAALVAKGLDCVFLLAPTSTVERAARVCEAGSGFIYYVSLKGVTGASTLDPAGIKAHLDGIRAHCGLPVAVGFGIKDGASARAVAPLADAIVVGSVLVSAIESHLGDIDAMEQAVVDILGALRVGLVSALAA